MVTTSKTTLNNLRVKQLASKTTLNNLGVKQC